MRNRRAWARAIASILAGCMTMAAVRAHGQSIEGVPPPQRERVTNVTRAALQLLTEWLGPPRFGTLTVRGVASTGSVATAQPGVIVIPIRWLALERDRALERDVIPGVTRQFWLRNAPATQFEQALVLYTAARAIHHLLEGSNFAAVRFFGGVIPFPLRSVLLSPPVTDRRPRAWPFDDRPVDAEVVRIVRGLQTLERYVGWPAMAQALTTMRAAPDAALDADIFATTLSTVRGTDLTALVRQCFRSDAVFDYAIDEVTSSASAAGLYETSLTLARHGSGVFEVGADGDREGSMPVLVRFADGTELRDWFDGGRPSSTLVYTAKAPIVHAAVDPEMMLLLDVNRANNTFATASPVRPLGIRLALHWMSWLQHTMLAYTALV